jgi:hypothetical protein
MLSRFAIASARCVPMVRTEGSLEDGAGVSVGADAPLPAGVGVCGIADEGADDWDGAAGGAGVDSTAFAGVEGAFDVDAEDVGAAFGYRMLEIVLRSLKVCYLRNHADNESLLFNAVGLNSVGILQDLAFDELVPRLYPTMSPEGM